VDIDRGEMGFAIFDFDPSLDELVKGSISNIQKLEELAKRIGDDALPTYIRRFIVTAAGGSDSAISFQASASAYGSEEEKSGIYRKRGLMGASQMTGGAGAVHFLKIFANDAGKARLYYKFDGSIQFIKNMK
jgi:hypothetical protein